MNFKLAITIFGLICISACAPGTSLTDKELRRVYAEYVVGTDELGKEILATKNINGREAKVSRLKEIYETHRKFLLRQQSRLAAIGVKPDSIKLKAAVGDILDSELKFTGEYIANYTEYLETKDIEILKKGAQITDRHELERAKLFNTYRAAL